MNKINRNSLNVSRETIYFSLHVYSDLKIGFLMINNKNLSIHVAEYIHAHDKRMYDFYRFRR